VLTYFEPASERIVVNPINLIGIRMGKYERRSDEMAQLAKHDAYAESKHGMLVDLPENDVFVQGLGVN
jgi:hypothetical protein